MSRLPLTIIFLLLLISIGVVFGMPWQSAPQWLIERFGFASVDIRTGAWHRIIWSVFFSSGGFAFYKVIGLTSISCAAYELRHGARRLFIAFWFLHITTLVIEALAIAPFVFAGAPWALVVDTAYDVGPSAGCYGLLGALWGEIPRPWKHALLIAIGLVTGGNILYHCAMWHWGALSGDIAHIISMSLGFICRNALAPGALALSPTSSATETPPTDQNSAP